MTETDRQTDRQTNRIPVKTELNNRSQTNRTQVSQGY